MAERIYLDYNATAPLHPLVQTRLAAMPTTPYNPSSIHSFGRDARKLVEQAKAAILASLGVKNAEQDYLLIFTGSASEANNLALSGVGADSILCSAIEHPSVLKPAEGRKAVKVPVDTQGVLDLAALESLLKQTSSAGKRMLLSVMLANNETGVIQPLAQIIALAKSYGAWVHSDAVQAYGKIAIDLPALDADMLTIASHKVGGPAGVAALLIKRSIPLAPQILGGGQQQGLRAGTENVHAIVGFAELAKLVPSLIIQQQQLALWRDAMEAELTQAVIFSHKAQRLPNTSCLVMPGVQSETQLIRLDIAGIAVSAGSACSSGKIGRSHVLAAMGASEEQQATSLRISLGFATTAQEVQIITAAWQSIYNELGAAASNLREYKYA